MQRKIQFANLVIRFGEKELLDYAAVVSRAFLNDTNIRKIKSGSFFFFETSVWRLVENDPMTTVISGRFVKDSFLKREQVYSSSGLKEDHQRIQTSPSSFFVLFLADHRIAISPETEYAPTISNLEATIRRFVKSEFKEFIDKLYKEENSEGRKVTKVTLFSEHTPPSVNLVPLTSASEISAFIDKFQKIEKLTVRLIDRNQDVDGGNLFERLTERTSPLEPTSAKLEVRGTGEGLDREETKSFVKETTDGGYEDVSLIGTDGSGARLAGSNDDFRLEVSEDLSEIPATKARQISRAYENQKKAGNISVSKRDRDRVEPVLKDLYDPSNA